MPYGMSELEPVPDHGSQFQHLPEDPLSTWQHGVSVAENNMPELEPPQAPSLPDVPEHLELHWNSEYSPVSSAGT